MKKNQQCGCENDENFFVKKQRRKPRGIKKLTIDPFVKKIIGFVSALFLGTLLHVLPDDEKKDLFEKNLGSVPSQKSLIIERVAASTKDQLITVVPLEKKTNVFSFFRENFPETYGKHWHVAAVPGEILFHIESQKKEENVSYEDIMPDIAHAILRVTSETAVDVNFGDLMNLSYTAMNKSIKSFQDVFVSHLDANDKAQPMAQLRLFQLRPMLFVLQAKGYMNSMRRQPVRDWDRWYLENIEKNIVKAEDLFRQYDTEFGNYSERSETSHSFSKKVVSKKDMGSMTPRQEAWMYYVLSEMYRYKLERGVIHSDSKKLYTHRYEDALDSMNISWDNCFINERKARAEKLLLEKERTVMRQIVIASMYDQNGQNKKANQLREGIDEREIHSDYKKTDHHFYCQ